VNRSIAHSGSSARTSSTSAPLLRECLFSEFTEPPTRVGQVHCRAVLLRSRRDHKRMRIGLRATRPNHEEARCELPVSSTRARNILLKVEILEVQEEGPYMFEILFDGGKLARTLQLAVTRTPPAATSVR
jgi:hypothetical protein